MRPVPPTSADVSITVPKNGSLNEVFQFDDATITYWDFNNKTFSMSIKGNYEQAALITMTSPTDIVVNDAALRILQITKGVAALQAALVPGCYIYDLLMTETGSGVVTQLMHGRFNFAEGVT